MAAPLLVHNVYFTLHDGSTANREKLMAACRKYLTGHPGTVFAERKNVVYYADFTPYSSGCVVVAVDLKTKKKLWKTDLKGLGPINHTKYRNAVILEVKDDVIRVQGQESAGRYLEYVDMKSGKTLGHRVFDQK